MKEAKLKHFYTLACLNLNYDKKTETKKVANGGIYQILESIEIYEGAILK